jgi:hypothetical protein
VMTMMREDERLRFAERQRHECEASHAAQCTLTCQDFDSDEMGDGSLSCGHDGDGG